MTESIIRTSPLSPDEKKELTNLLDKLKLRMKSGQVTLHFNDGLVSAVQSVPPMLR